MKQFLQSIFFITFFSNSLFGQISEGHISYKISTSTDNPELQMVISMMQGSTMDVYFSKDKTRSEMTMGAMMSVVTISNNSTDEILLLMGGMMGQKAMKSKLSEMASNQDDSIPKPVVTLVDETKEIQGFKCKKAVLTDSEGVESIYWYTTEIEIAKKGQTYLNDQIPGFPMEFDLNNNGIKMTMIVQEFEKKLDRKKIDSLFEMKIPEGYETISQEDLMNGSLGGN